MKEKRYVSPDTSAWRVSTENIMQSASTQGDKLEISDSGVDGSKALAPKHRSVWDDEEDEDENNE